MGTSIMTIMTIYQVISRQAHKHTRNHYTNIHIDIQQGPNSKAIVTIQPGNVIMRQSHRIRLSSYFNFMSIIL